MKLLVVEDSPLLRKMFGLAFPHQLNDIKPAENGREAMELLATTAEPDDSALMAQARSLGVAAVVKKPWSPQSLRAVVQKVIDSPTR
jgi:response regulator RpfG family c-di-GMP phosphodiesterase